MTALTIHHGALDNWFVLGDERGCRINGADIEGSREEWAAVADAIERGESVHFKRVAFSRQPSSNWLASSPRNSISPSVVGAGVAAQLVVEIRRVLAETPVDVPVDYGDDE